MLVTVNTGRTKETKDNELVLYPIIDLSFFIVLFIITIITVLFYFIVTFIFSFDPSPNNPDTILISLITLLPAVCCFFMLIFVFISLFFLKKIVITESEINLIFSFAFVQYKSETFRKQDFKLFFSHKFQNILISSNRYRSNYKKVVRYFLTLFKDESEEEYEIGIIIKNFLGLPREEIKEFLNLLNNHGILFDQSSLDLMTFDYDDYITKEKNKLTLELQNSEI